MNLHDLPLDLPSETLRVPPHSLEAEQALLGGLLLDNRAWDRIGAMLTEADFYRLEHRSLFAAIAGLINAHKPADVVTVKVALGDKAEECGGAAYLDALALSVPSAAHAKRYAEIVRERALQRGLIAAVMDADGIAWEDGAFGDRLDRISAAFAGLERQQMRKGPVGLDSLVVKAIDRYNEIAEGSGPKGWPTGIAPLDRLLAGRGLLPGRTYGIAARPSVGKSSIARAIGVNVALEGHPVLLLSQEMPEDEVTDCIIAQLGAIDGDRLQSGGLDDAEWGRMAEAVDIAGKAPFFVDDQGGLTLADIRAKARQVKGLRVLVLDYLQLSASTLKNANRNDQVGEISRGLKALALEMGIAVLVLSQLNREVEKRVDKEPKLSDLRDSGEIEQDLDVALLLWTAREDDPLRRIVGAVLAKQRGGKRNMKFALEFQPAVSRWYESTYDLRGPSKTESRGGYE